MDFKRIGLVILFTLLMLGGLQFLRISGSDQTEEPLRFMTWSNYFPEPLLEKFTRKTGIRVEISYMSSNEEMFAKFRAGATGFDLIQPSDYMVAQMRKLEMLVPLNHAQLTNLTHIDDYFKNLPYDPLLRFSVPFTSGTTGIAVNTRKVKMPQGEISWKVLLSPDVPGQISLLDDMREVFGAGLAFHGKSINSTDADVLRQIQKSLLKAKGKVLTFSSEVKPLLLKGEVVMAHVFSVDAVQASIENPDIQYFLPAEGGTVWTDNFAIPKGAKSVEKAHQFINYFLDPDNAFELMTQNHLATPNRAVRERLPEDQKNNPNLYPSPETLKRFEFLSDIGPALRVMNRLWTEVKSN